MQLGVLLWEIMDGMFLDLRLGCSVPQLPEWYGATVSKEAQSMGPSNWYFHHGSGDVLKLMR